MSCICRLERSFLDMGQMFWRVPDSRFPDCPTRWFVRSYSLFMVGFMFHDPEASIDLLQQNDSHQLMREGQV